MSAAYNCALNCTNPKDTRIGAACAVKSVLSTITPDKPICSDSDVSAGRWVKLYWDSDEDCGEGYDSTWWPGIMKEKTCCTASQRCNAPGATPPSLRCFSTKFSPAAGYCAGKTSSVSVCTASQARADERGSLSTKVSTRDPSQLSDAPTPPNCCMYLELIWTCSLQKSSTPTVHTFPF